MMKIALIGYGYWGPNIAKNINISKKAELYAICDTDETKLSKAQKIYGNSVLYKTDYHEIIKQVDAFAIALRQDCSYTIAQELLQEKKHLFMEKPLSRTAEEAMELGRLSEQNGVVLHVDHIMIFNPFVRKIKQMIESGELGEEILYYDICRMNLGPQIKKDINVMWDLAVHDLAVLDYFNNGEVAKEISAMGMNYYSNQSEVTYLNIRYEKAIASVRSSWISPVKERRMIVAGTRKMAVFDDCRLDDKLIVYDRGFQEIEKYDEYGRYEAKLRMGDICLPHIETEDSLLNSLEHFIDCINQNKMSIANCGQAYRVLSILEQADNMLRGEETWKIK